jgi:hypothetical protein
LAPVFSRHGNNRPQLQRARGEGIPALLEDFEDLFGEGRG